MDKNRKISINVQILCHEMDLNKRNEFITKATLELLQGILPTTNILSSIDDSDEESNRSTDDMDEVRLFRALLTGKNVNVPVRNAPGPSSSRPRPSTAPTKKAAKPPTKSPPKRMTGYEVIESDVNDAIDVDDDVGAIEPDDTVDIDDDEIISIGSAAPMTFFDIFQQQMMNDLDIKIGDVLVSNFDCFLFYPENLNTFSFLMTIFPRIRTILSVSAEFPELTR